MELVVAREVAMPIFTQVKKAGLGDLAFGMADSFCVSLLPNPEQENFILHEIEVDPLDRIEIDE